MFMTTVDAHDDATEQRNMMNEGNMNQVVLTTHDTLVDR